MPDKPKQTIRNVRRTALFAALFVFIAIAFLGWNVAREVNRFDSRKFDGVLWSLSQTEIEYLEFTNTLDGPDTHLPDLRLRYDVLYSRIRTISVATGFEYLRQSAAFREELDTLLGFLDQTVPLIDADDATLRDTLPELARLAAETRSSVRQLAIVGLDLLTLQSDTQRNGIARTTAQLGAAIAALFAGLAIALYKLDRANSRSVERGRALQQSAMRMNTIIRTSLDGVIVTDAERKVLEFSPAAEEIFATTAQKALGRDLLEFIDLVSDHADGDPDAAWTKSILVGQGRLKRDAKRADGATFPAEIAIQSASTEDGDILIAFVRDISRRVAAEDALVAARDTALANERIKTDFLATMSHEIRTPLNGLLGNMDLLRDTVLNAPQERYVHNMETSGRMLMRHVSDVLDLTQFDTGKMKVRHRAIHLPTLIEDIIATQSSLATAQRTDLSWEWAGPPAEWVRADPDRIQHILMNLVGNAVKFTKDGAVTVTVSKSDSERQPHLRFTIADTGPGISPNLVPRIFDDFVTGDTAYDRTVGGTGLGLSIAKRFATALGGDITVDSVLGEGSTFSFDIPVELAKNPRAQSRQKTLPPIHTQDILVVEDNAINRTVVREMLEADGHRVTTAENGEAGVALAHETAFDLILMDISMPVMDGREAAQLIKTGYGASSDSPIIALTANALAADKAGFEAAGMIATITKPLTRIALREVMREMNMPVVASQTEMINVSHLAETRQTLSGEAYDLIKLRYADEVNGFLVWLGTTPKPPLEDVAKQAHRIAGSSALFGAENLRNALLELEEVALEGNSLRAFKFAPLLSQLWIATQNAMVEADAASAATA